MRYCQQSILLGKQLHNHQLYFLNNKMLSNYILTHIFEWCYLYMFEELLSQDKKQHMSKQSHQHNNPELKDIQLHMLESNYLHKIDKNHYENIQFNYLYVESIYVLSKYFVICLIFFIIFLHPFLKCRKVRSLQNLSIGLVQLKVGYNYNSRYNYSEDQPNTGDI